MAIYCKFRGSAEVFFVFVFYFCIRSVKVGCFCTNLSTFPDVCELRALLVFSWCRHCHLWFWEVGDHGSDDFFVAGRRRWCHHLAQCPSCLFSAFANQEADFKYPLLACSFHKFCTQNSANYFMSLMKCSV